MKQRYNTKSFEIHKESECLIRDLNDYEERKNICGQPSDNSSDKGAYEIVVCVLSDDGH